MTAFDKWIAVTACIVGIGAVVLTLNHQQARTQRKLHSHVLAENVNRIKDLQIWIARNAALDPVNFVSVVGSGVNCDAISLPTAILDQLPPSVRSEELKDTFGHPFHVALSRCRVGSGVDTNRYEILIWSDGPNGVNELGKGDDVAPPKHVVSLE